MLTILCRNAPRCGSTSRADGLRVYSPRVLLETRAEIWRLLPDPAKAGRTLEQPWRKGLACHLEPISAIDHTVSFALESTHIIFLPVWFVGLRREDEIRLSGRTDNAGVRMPNRYIVKGIRRYPTFGLRHVAAYVQERL